MMDQNFHLNCEEPGCVNWIPDDQWRKIKAEGWFQMKDGTIFCPEHIPEWVAEWRKKRDHHHG